MFEISLPHICSRAVCQTHETLDWRPCRTHISHITRAPKSSPQVFETAAVLLQQPCHLSTLENALTITVLTAVLSSSDSSNTHYLMVAVAKANRNTAGHIWTPHTPHILTWRRRQRMDGWMDGRCPLTFLDQFHSDIFDHDPDVMWPFNMDENSQREQSKNYLLTIK